MKVERRRRPRVKSDRSAGIQYAALPWRRVGATLEIMLVTSRETRRWVIPKGWPMLGLSPGECAAQEAFEEAGVRGRMGGMLGVFGYDKIMKDGTARPLQVEVFGLEVTEELAEWPELGQRDRKWTSGAEAAGSVDEPELAQIIRRFTAVSVPPQT